MKRGSRSSEEYFHVTDMESTKILKNYISHIPLQNGNSFGDALKTIFNIPLETLSQPRKFLSYKIKPQRDHKNYSLL